MITSILAELTGGLLRAVTRRWGCAVALLLIPFLLVILLLLNR